MARVHNFWATASTAPRRTFRLVEEGRELWRCRRYHLYRLRSVAKDLTPPTWYLSDEQEADKRKSKNVAYQSICFTGLPPSNVCRPAVAVDAPVNHRWHLADGTTRYRKGFCCFRATAKNICTVLEEADPGSGISCPELVGVCSLCSGVCAVCCSTLNLRFLATS